jgi:hypothetical protein
MIDGHTSLIGMNQDERRASHPIAVRHPEPSGKPLGQYGLAAPQFTVEAHDVARLQEAAEAFADTRRLRGVLCSEAYDHF